MSSLDQVRCCWLDLAARNGCGAPAAHVLLDEIVRAYREPHRHYHTLDHIAALLGLLARHADAATDRDTVALAILLHDVVYAPGRRDNEEASAAWATAGLGRLGVAPQVIARVARCIVATRHDQPPEADPDLALLLDLDLSILAAPAAGYHAYAAAIRREHASIPDELYRPGRRRILEGMLVRPALYQTPRLRGLWETQARANLAAELAALA